MKRRRMVTGEHINIVGSLKVLVATFSSFRSGVFWDGVSHQARTVVERAFWLLLISGKNDAVVL